MDVAAFKQAYSDLIAAARAELQRETRPFCPLTPSAGPTGLLDSRFGGPIAWPAGEPTPEDAEGAPMVFALQINLGDCNPPPDFPKSGLLQLFLANDVAERGITFLRQHRQAGDFPLQNGDGFQVVYHKDTSALRHHDHALPNVEYPIFLGDVATRPTGLRVGDADQQMRPINHWQSMVLMQRFEALPEFTANAAEIGDFLAQELWGDTFGPAAYIGGYADPIQSDHRFFFEEYRTFDRCLMQITSIPGFDFGDLSLAILVGQDDLAKAAFGGVIAIASTD